MLTWPSDPRSACAAGAASASAVAPIRMLLSFMLSFLLAGSGGRSGDRPLRQIVEMAGGAMPRRALHQLRHVDVAAVEDLGAAGVEDTAARRVGGARHVTLQDDALAPRLDLRI